MAETFVRITAAWVLQAEDKVDYRPVLFGTPTQASV